MKSLVSLTVSAALFCAGMPFITSQDSVKRGEYTGLIVRDVSSEAPVSVLPAVGAAKAEYRSVLFVPSITATNSYALTNDQGVAGPSAGDELEYTVNIVNSGTDAFKVIFKDVIDENTTLVPGSVKVAPIVADDEYYTIGNVGLNIPAGEGVLANDLSANGASLVIVTTSPITTSQGGTVDLNTTTGAFTYTPPAGFSGTDTFDYTVQSGSDLTATGTVSIELEGRIWFINSAASPTGANGTLAKPFTGIGAFQAINDGGAGHAQNGDNIFIYHAVSSYDGTFTLRDNQKIAGQGAAVPLLTIINLTAPDGVNLLPSTGGTAPVITTTASAANAVNLAKNNLVRGVNVAAVERAKISGDDFGTLVLRDISLSGKGTALNLSNGTLDASIAELSSTTEEAPGISATDVSGQLECTTGTISSSMSIVINISGTPANVALGLEFVSVSSSQAAKGIALFRTTGTFSVSGAGTAGSGGSISNISGRGAEFRNAAGITLKYMAFSNANTAEGTPVSGYDNTGSNAAVYAGTVNGLRLENVTLGGTMVQTGVSLNAVSGFHFINSSIGAAGTGKELHEGNIYAINTSGTCSIVNSSFSKPTGRAVYFLNNNTNLAMLTVDNSRFEESFNAAGLLVEAAGNSVANVKVLNNDFLKNQATSVVANAYGTAVINADIKENTFDPTNAAISPHDVGVAIDLTGSDQSDVNFNVLDNNIKAKGTNAINVFIKDNGYAEGTISGNTVAMQNGAGAGISVRAEGVTGKADGVVLITNNTITGVNSDSGIFVTSFSRSTGRVDATINNNSVSLTNGGLNSSFYNIELVAQGLTTSPDNTNTGKVCANVRNNIIPVGGRGDLGVGRIRSGAPATSPGPGTEILLPGTGSTFQQIWENNGNTAANPSDYATSGAGNFTYGAPACALPDIPELRLADSGAGADDIFEKKPLERKEPVITHRPKRKMNLPVGGTGEGGFSSAREAAGETVLVNGTGDGFTLPENGEVTIKFRVTINTDIPEGVCSVSNQGTINGEGFAEVLTDDPGASGTDNPTVTNLLAAPVINTCPGDITYNLNGESCVQEASFTAIAVGCPAPVVSYEAGGGAITFPYNFPTGTTRVYVRADNGVGTLQECFFDVTVNCTPLPVTLARFGVRKEGKSAVLSWETTSESNAEKFSVQKSSDAHNWVEIGIVGARNKGESAQKYSFTDADLMGAAFAGAIYYRLKMIDLDASFGYSEIRTVDIGRVAETLIYPNPVSDQVQLEVQDWRNVKEIEFFDLTGRRVYHAEGNRLAATVSVKGYAAGMYLISIRYIDGTQTTRRFQVVH